MAALSKITNLPAFSNELELHSGLPVKIAITVAAILPWLELVCGLCLALGIAVREAATLLSALLILFLGYAVLHFHGDDCRCFLFPTPAALDLRGWWPVTRDFLLLLCAFILAIPRNK